MTNTVKTTKKAFYTAIMDILAGNETNISADEVMAFCEKEIATLDARAEKAKERAAEKRAQGDELLEAVLAALTDEPATRDEITARVEFDEEVSVSKVGYRLTQLVRNGQAIKDEATVPNAEGKSRKVSVYRLA